MEHLLRNYRNLLRRLRFLAQGFVDLLGSINSKWCVAASSALWYSPRQVDFHRPAGQSNITVIFFKDDWDIYSRVHLHTSLHNLPPLYRPRQPPLLRSPALPPSTVNPLCQPCPAPHRSLAYLGSCLFHRYLPAA